MSHTPEIGLLYGGQTVSTNGLAAVGHPELSASVTDPRLLPEAETFLHFVADYVARGNPIAPGETLAYGYWMTQFRPEEDLLAAWEYNAGATEYVPGVNLTLGYWRDQHEVCEKYGGAFSPPRPDRLVVISDGVLEGDAVQGVRYPSPEHMSGWWITTDRYDGNVDSLRREHLYHLTAARPDLARYVALPFGFRFDNANGEDVWFDRKAAQE
jgi:hypothetical protein